MFFGHIWPALWPLPNIFSKIDSSPEAYGILASLFMGWCSSFPWPPRRLSAHVQGLLAQGWEICDLLIFSLQTRFSPLCSCHDYCLKVSTGSKAWLFILFQVSLHRANRRLVVSILTWFPLTLFQEIWTGCKCLARSPSFLAPRNVKTRGQL